MNVPYTPAEYHRELFNCLKGKGYKVRLQDEVIAYDFSDEEMKSDYDAAQEECESELSARLPDPKNEWHMRLERDRLLQIREAIVNAGFDTPPVPSVAELSGQWASFGGSSWDPYLYVPEDRVIDVMRDCDNQPYRPEVVG